MPYIYKITNIINEKVYIGKTINPIEHRWREHCSEYNKNKNEKRPLYNAMKKYGVENFKIEEIEKCSLHELNERERYWIGFFGSFKNGYNAILGGDGRPYVDYDLIYKLYQETKNVKKVKELTGHDTETISKILDSFGITQKQRKLNANISISKPVAKYDLKTGEILRIYVSAIEAEKEHGNTKHINDVCKGKRKSCKGFGWKYI